MMHLASWFLSSDAQCNGGRRATTKDGICCTSAVATNRSVLSSSENGQTPRHNANRPTRTNRVQRLLSKHLPFFSLHMNIGHVERR